MPTHKKVLIEKNGLIRVAITSFKFPACTTCVPLHAKAGCQINGLSGRNLFIVTKAESATSCGAQRE